jgi:glutamate-5-semialdehyde dehydrogenase
VTRRADGMIPSVSDNGVLDLVAEAARAARAASGALGRADAAAVTVALHGIAERLGAEREPVLAANQRDVADLPANTSRAFADRLKLSPERLTAMAAQIVALAESPDADPGGVERTLESGVRVRERRRPVGVIGANYEARPNVTVDVASQLLKSRNAGVLRTGGAALRSATELIDRVVRPAYAAAGLDPDAIQLVRTADREAARALVSFPELIPLVILRGSGETTAALARHAAEHGVRTLAHAEGGGVLYVDDAADPELALRLIGDSLDRLGVCNRLNLLLVAGSRWDELLPRVTARLDELGIAASLPPHDHPLGYEWALDDERAATVTIAPVADPEAAAAIANDETSGLAAAIVTADAGAAERFLTAYAGTGAFWNASTRLLDGFALLGAPETGINVDHVPGPRGPVTFRDLYLRQYVVTPGA